MSKESTIIVSLPFLSTSGSDPVSEFQNITKAMPPGTAVLENAIAKSLSVGEAMRPTTLDAQISKVTTATPSNTRAASSKPMPVAPPPTKLVNAITHKPRIRTRRESNREMSTPNGIAKTAPTIASAEITNPVCRRLKFKGAPWSIGKAMMALPI